MAQKKVHSYKVTMKCERCADDVCTALNKLDDNEKEVEVDYKSSTVKVCTSKSVQDVIEVLRTSGMPTEYISTVILGESPKFVGVVSREKLVTPKPNPEIVKVEHKLKNPSTTVQPSISSGSWSPPKQY